jgi:hypothetical protein
MGETCNQTFSTSKGGFRARLWRSGNLQPPEIWACALFALPPLPWQSAGHRALRIASAHGENYTRHEHAQPQQPPLRLGKDELQGINGAALHLFPSVPIALARRRLCLFLPVCCVDLLATTCQIQQRPPD